MYDSIGTTFASLSWSPGFVPKHGIKPCMVPLGRRRHEDETFKVTPGQPQIDVSLSLKKQTN